VVDFAVAGVIDCARRLLEVANDVRVLRVVTVTVVVISHREVLVLDDDDATLGVVVRRVTGYLGHGQTADDVDVHVAVVVHIDPHLAGLLNDEVGVTVALGDGLFVVPLGDLLVPVPVDHDPDLRLDQVLTVREIVDNDVLEQLDDDVARIWS
jgi:hypothetical protein